eukprot:213604-Chlamydomonas_euryale.AAC.23
MLKWMCEGKIEGKLKAKLKANFCLQAKLSACMRSTLPKEHATVKHRKPPQIVVMQTLSLKGFRCSSQASPEAFRIPDPRGTCAGRPTDPAGGSGMGSVILPSTSHQASRAPPPQFPPLPVSAPTTTVLFIVVWAASLTDDAPSVPSHRLRAPYDAATPVHAFALASLVVQCAACGLFVRPAEPV